MKNPFSAFLARRDRLRREEREHQRALIEGVALRLVEIVKSNQDGLLALARAQQAQADVLTTWLKGFQSPDALTPVDGHVYRDEDIALKEELTSFNGLPIDQLPAEFQLAYALQAAEGDFDREGRDI